MFLRFTLPLKNQSKDFAFNSAFKKSKQRFLAFRVAKILSDLLF